MSPSFSRSLPPAPDFAQQKKQARELLAAFAAGDPEAKSRVRAVLPDKPRIVLADAQFVIAREYGFNDWSALKRHIRNEAHDSVPVDAEIHDAFHRHDAAAVRRLFERHPELRGLIDAPIFPFNAPAIVAYAGDLAMVEVLLDFGADPNRRSEWWAGGFHALHAATDATALRLLEAGAIPDACAAAHLDRRDLLVKMLSADPNAAHQRGGDGQTPLHFAKSRSVIDLLLSAGADVDARDVDHRSTPAQWMLAGKRGAGRYELARYLVDRGATADIFLAAALGLENQARTLLDEDPGLLELRTGRGIYGEQPPSSYHIYFWTIGEGHAPLDVAAQFDHPEMLELMLRYASPLHRLHFACRSADEEGARAVLRDHPSVVSTMTEDDHRMIADAAWNGSAKEVSLMLSVGYDPRTPGRDSGTALHCAAWQGSADTVAALLRHPDVRQLVDVRDARHGATPLGWCCHGSKNGNGKRDHVAVARLLLNAGARQGPDTQNASPAVSNVLQAWRESGADAR